MLSERKKKRESKQGVDRQNHYYKNKVNTYFFKFGE